MDTEDTFADAYAKGDAQLDDVGSWVDVWHDGPEGFVTLASFLGLSAEEAARWEGKPDDLGEILDARSA